MILNKKQMTEVAIKLNYITPAINASGWQNGINTMETKITDGKINIRGNMVYREKEERANYLHYLNKYRPIAIVEAKDKKKTISHGFSRHWSMPRYWISRLLAVPTEMVFVNMNF